MRGRFILMEGFLMIKCNKGSFVHENYGGGA